VTVFSFPKKWIFSVLFQITVLKNYAMQLQLVNKVGSQAQSRHNPVKCLAQEHNKRTCQPIFTLTLLNAECEAGKL